MLRTKKLRKQKKKARSRVLKYSMMLAGITLAGIVLIAAVVALWPTGSKTTSKDAQKKQTTKKTTTKKPAKKPTSQPVKKPTTTNSAPVLTIEEPPDGFETTQNTALIKGTTTPGSTLLVDGNKYEIKQDGTFTISVDLVRGINRFVLTSISPQNKTTEKEVVINKLH